MDGINNENALHIIIAIRGKYVPMVLIVNGSRLNVCPLKVASCLGLGIEDFTPIKQTVKAYDNSKKEVIRIVSIDVTINLP